MKLKTGKIYILSDFLVTCTYLSWHPVGDLYPSLFRQCHPLLPACKAWATGTKKTKDILGTLPHMIIATIVFF